MPKTKPKTKTNYAALRQHCEALARLIPEHPRDAVQGVVQLLDACKSPTETQDVMDAATAAGFACEFWPNCVRVWIPKVTA